MSQSITATRCPWAARPAARLTVTEDLPTPPLPEATASTRVVDSSPQKVIFFCCWAAPGPRRRVTMAWRWSSVMTPRSTLTPVTPGRGETAAVTSLVMRSLSGQPATVSSTSTVTRSRSVMGRWISGSITCPRAARTSSRVTIREDSPSEPCRAKPPVFLECSERRDASPWADGVGSPAMADYDAIVCGGGTNGLAAAIRLAEAGWSVCLLEANDDLGGATRTLESTLPGFKHDFGAAFFPLVAPSPSIIGRDLAPYGLRFVHAPVPAAHPFPGNQAIALGRSAVETASSIDKVHLGDGAAWFALDEAFGEVMKHFLRAQMQRWPLEELAKVIGRLRLAGSLEFARMVVSGVSSVAQRFESEQARAFLTGPAMHADLQPEEPGTGIYALLLWMLGQRFGMPVVEGGTGRITDALAAKARHEGVEILTGRRVDRIVVSGGRAVAVEAAGEAFRARRAVICALEVDALVRLAGPESFPPRALAEIRYYRPGLGTFKVDWALDGQVPWAAEECRRAGVVHVGDTLTEMSRSAWEAAHGLLPAKPTLILGQQSLADPSRAPAGKHTLWGYAHVPSAPTGDA